MGHREISVRLSFTRINIAVDSIGDDLCITVQGGKSHIGCTVLAIPRESLTGEGISCTSSVINVSGHKDEEICRYVAEKAAARNELLKTERTVLDIALDNGFSDARGFINAFKRQYGTTPLQYRKSAI